MKSGRYCRIVTRSCWWTALLNWKPERIVGIKNVTVNEPFFIGHFPDFPVMPGVLIVEAMAQTAGVLVLQEHSGPGQQAGAAGGRWRGRSFRKPVVPGDQLRIEMKMIKRKATWRRWPGARRSMACWWPKRK